MIETLAYTVVAIAVIGLVLWVYILLPYEMAVRRGRSGIVWVLVSLVFSPLVAIVLLWMLGDSARR